MATTEAGTGTRPRAMPGRWVYAGYFGLQAVVGVVLWIGVGTVPTVRSWMEIVPERRGVVDAFLYPDMAVIVVGSVLTAWAVAVGAGRAVPFAAFTAGAVLYPTVYLIGWVATNDGHGSTALAIMVPPSLLTSWVAYQIWSGRRRLTG